MLQFKLSNALFYMLIISNKHKRPIIITCRNNKNCTPVSSFLTSKKISWNKKKDVWYALPSKFSQLETRMWVTDKRVQQIWQCLFPSVNATAYLQTFQCICAHSHLMDVPTWIPLSVTKEVIITCTCKIEKVQWKSTIICTFDLCVLQKTIKYKFSWMH